VGWVYKHETLVASFSATTMIIANGWHGRRDFTKHFDGRLAHVDGRLAHVEDKLAGLRDDNEMTQGLVLNSALKTMKAIDGDRKGLRDFVAKAEKALRCIELGEDCQAKGG
jgi:hypothetical protein